jgi:hypothetical protein
MYKRNHINDELDSKVRIILINKHASSYLNLVESFHKNFLLEFLNGDQKFFTKLREAIIKWFRVFNDPLIDEYLIYDLVSPLIFALQKSLIYKSEFAKKFKNYQQIIPNDQGRFLGCKALKEFNNKFSVKIQLSDMPNFYEIIEKIRDTSIEILRPNIYDAYTCEITLGEYNICFNFHNNYEIPVITMSIIV